MDERSKIQLATPYKCLHIPSQLQWFGKNLASRAIGVRVPTLLIFRGFMIIGEASKVVDISQSYCTLNRVPDVKSVQNATLLVHRLYCGEWYFARASLHSPVRWKTPWWVTTTFEDIWKMRTAPGILRNIDLSCCHVYSCRGCNLDCWLIWTSVYKLAWAPTSPYD